MKQSMDYVSAALELQNMLTHSRERYLWMESPDKPFRTVNWFDALRASFRLRQLSWFHFGDPVTALELMDLAHLHHQDVIERKLRSSRRRATELRTGMMRHDDGQEREAFLLRAFIAHSLCGYKRVVACSVLFDAENVAHARSARVIWQYVALMLTPVIGVILLAITFYGALVVPKGSTKVFFLCSGLSLALNVLWQQPVVIWLLHVWFPSTAKRDVLALHWVLQVRAKTILTRHWGLLHSVNALVQHFHPACRAARLQPHLPVARLLMSLTDYDLPISAVLRRPRRRAVVYPTVQVLNTGSPLVYDCCVAISGNLLSQYRWCYALVTLCVMSLLRLTLHGLYLLPVWMRETVVEVLCSGSLLGLLALLYYTLKVDPSGASTGILLGVVVLLAGVSLYKIHVGIQREKEVLGRLKNQAEKYHIPCSTFTSE